MSFFNLKIPPLIATETSKISNGQRHRLGLKIESKKRRKRKCNQVQVTRTALIIAMQILKQRYRIQGKKADGNDVVETFEDTLIQKIEQLESKLESIIESKLGEKMNTLMAFNKSIQEQCDTLNKASVSYSASVQGISVPAGTHNLELRQIMRETKNKR